MEEILERLVIPLGSKPISFAEMQKKAYDIQVKCSDFLVKGSDISYSEVSGNILFSEQGCLCDRIRTFTDYSFGQLCTKLGIPVSYMTRCKRECGYAGEFSLVSENINSWLHNEFKDKEYLIRSFGQSMRGILSNRYSVLDTPDILEVVSEVLDENDFGVKGYFISPDRFQARIVQHTMMNIEGEDLFAGIQIDSSDVGRSNLVVRFMIYKQVCSNGLCISQSEGVLFSQRHVSIKQDEFREGLKVALEKLPTLVASAEKWVESCIEDSSFSIKTPEELKDFMERTNLSLPKESLEKLFNTMQSCYDLTKWGFINSLTKVAQEYTLEKRMEIEKFAGELLVS